MDNNGNLHKGLRRFDQRELVHILRLMDRLPTKRRENVERLFHTLKYGFLLILRHNGKIIGCAETFRMKEPPEYPVIPWPKDDPEGNVLYGFSAVCEKGKILKLFQMAKEMFKNCEYIAYHREKKNHKLYRERNELCSTFLKAHF